MSFRKNFRESYVHTIVLEAFVEYTSMKASMETFVGVTSMEAFVEAFLEAFVKCFVHEGFCKRFRGNFR